MEKIIKLLRETSEGRRHFHNMAKEYVILENNDFLSVGKDCLFIDNKLFVVDRSEENIIKFNKISSEYTLCYGISLTNIISLISNKEIKILGISTHKGETIGETRKWSITIQRPYRSYPESFYYDETLSLKDFEITDLANFLFDIYCIN